MPSMNNIGWTSKLKTDAATEPITTAEAKAHCRVTSSDDDTYIDTLIATGRKWLEGEIKRALITQSWYLYLDAFPDVIYLPMPPAITVTTFKYEDTDGATQTVTSTVYQTDVKTEPARIALAEGQSWPDVQSDTMNVVELDYTAGYGAASTVPADLKHIIKLAVKLHYDLREPIVTGTIISEYKGGASLRALLAQYKVDFFR